MSHQFTLTQPDWVAPAIAELPAEIHSLDDRMSAVIRFSAMNIEHETGGPFAAGVFNEESGKLITIGVNRVMAHQCSSAHAEIMALSLAQQIVGHFDLGADGMRHQLVVNWRPCAMCFGAVIWSGVRSLVIAGSGPELESITGFDEGPVTPDWVNALEARGIDLIDEVLTDEAIAVFHQFRNSGAYVYNARNDESHS